MEYPIAPKASLSEKIFGETQKLKGRYVDCQNCPPERNCCVFKGKYEAIFTKEKLLRLIGMDEFTNLVGDKKLIQDTRNQDLYHMREMSCPALSVDYLCEVYGQREEIGLVGCVNFPMTLIRNYISQGLPEPIDAIMINYMCYSVEQNWEQMKGELLGLCDSSYVLMLVRYIDQQEFQTQKLRIFERLRDKGKIPPQIRS